MSKNASFQRKALQLSRQVQETLELALSAASDPQLQEVQIISVEPISGASHLRVLVSGAEAESLNGAKGWLRSQVASAINRRKTPFLEWVLL